METCRQEVLAVVESLACPSSLEEIADAVEAVRVRARPRLTEFHAPGECVTEEEVLARLRELKESGQVKGYARDVWVGLGVDPGGTVRPTGLLWWPMARWREAAVRRARRDLVERRRAEARQEEERAKREGPLREAVERTLEQRRWNARHPYEGLDPL
ncbi:MULTISPECIES: hypothetical protein [Streptomyces]|uniref:Uncharacterized protein n=1 Tax=Streptomyces sindenensis TaxID=67363 RepID=A0ABW6EJK3_9ACTN|nr:MULTISPECIES: hypothetical protein [Streptomyces]WGP09968.1 hypothetical protein QFA72_09885 [Streptomyces sp. SH5]